MSMCENCTTCQSADKVLEGFIGSMDMETSHHRVEKQKIKCGFGQQGVCCRLCANGPCRITAKSPNGVCGANADTIVARNFLRAVASGAACYLHVIENTALNLKSIGETKGTIKGVNALNRVAEILNMGDRILPLQLDKEAANRYQKLLKDKGIDIYTSAKLEEVILKENGFVDKVKLSDGTEIECDMIVVAAGVRPNVGFIKNESIKVERGIVVDNTGSTSAKDVYAAGDVTFTAPIWPIAVKQGIVAAYNMTGHEKYLEDTFALRNSMNFLGLECVSLGNIEAPDDSYVVDIIKTENVYKKIIHKYGIVYGAILMGDISYCGVLQQIVKNKIDISNIDKNIFNIDYSDFFSIKEDGQFKYKAV